MIELQGGSATDPALLLRNNPFTAAESESESDEEPGSKVPDVPKPLEDQKLKEQEEDSKDAPPPPPQSPAPEDNPDPQKEDVAATAALGSPKIRKVEETVGE